MLPLGGWNVPLLLNRPTGDWHSGLKEQLEPAVSNGLQMPHEFEDTQFSPLLHP